MSETDKVLQKVRALLDKATSTTFEAEAEAFRAKADELMTKHAITQYMIDQAKEVSERRETPELGSFEICRTNHPFKQDLLTLSNVIVSHVRCRMVYQSDGWSGSLFAKVIGFPADIRYAEMLYMNLRVQMESHLEPKPNPDQSDEENYVNLLESGLSRKRIAELMDMPLKESSYQRISKAWIAWAEENGIPYKGKTSRPNPLTYQRNFTVGFVNTVAMRFYEIRQRQEREGMTAGANAMVLYDRNKEVDDAYAAAFPRVRKSKPTARARFNAKAMERGNKAGREADIGLSRIGNQRKELPG